MRIRLLTIAATLAVVLTVPAWAHHSLVDYDKTLQLADGRRFDIGDLFAPPTVQVAPQEPRR